MIWIVIKETSGLIYVDLLSPKPDKLQDMSRLEILVGKMYVDLDYGFSFLIINDLLVVRV